MKPYSALPFLAAAAFGLSVPAFAQNGNWCGTDEVRRQMIQENPALLHQEAEYENGLQAYLRSRDGQRDGDDTTVFVIPLVFHILYDPTYTDDVHNVSDQQIFDQVALLNEHYAALNSDLSEVCCGFDSRIGNAKIRWELATKDPFGNCTNGIDRITSLRSSFAGNFSKLNPWFRDKYVNVWVIRNFPPISGGAILLGFSQLPADVQDASGSLRDGVIMIASSLAGGNFDATTLSHELGHYLNLQHTWGSTNDPEVACGDDGVEDTPMTKGHSSCNVYDSFCSQVSMDTAYAFSSVTTSSGTSDPTPTPSLNIHDTLLAMAFSPVTAQGVSANSTTAGAFAFNQWGTGSLNGDTAYAQFTGAINTAQYYEFTITPQLGISAPLSGLTFTVDRSADGPRTFAVRSSATGFGANLNGAIAPLDTVLSLNGTNTFYFTKDTSGFPVLATITASFANQVDPLTFRIYGWNAEDANGSFSVDNLMVTGKYGEIENVQNFMEYSGCSHMFTHGQTDRMRATLAMSTSGRNNLWAEQNQAQVGIDGNQVSCAPEADFYTMTPFVCPNTQVQFKANVKRATATSWNWTFEGGNPATSTDQNPFVSFETPGYHAVTLTVANDQGQHTTTKDLAVLIGADWSEVNGLLNQPFNNMADFWSWPTVNYENNSSYWGWTDEVGHDAPGCSKLNASQTFDKIQDIFSSPDAFLHDQDILMTPSLDLSNVSDVEFSFWYAYKTRTSVAADITESLEIAYSTDCGKTWLVKDNLTGGELVTAGIGDAGWIPGAGDWQQITLSMGSIVEDNHVRFRFRYTSGLYSNDLFLDDVKINGTVGIHELAQSGGMSLFPNPATDRLTVELDLGGASTAQFSILDMTGRTVFARPVSANDRKLDLDLAALDMAPAVYMVRLDNGLGQRTEKLVVR